MVFVSTVVIVQTGSTLPTLRARRGDFPQWFAEELRRGGAESSVVHVAEGEALPPLEMVSGAVVTGSHAMVTDALPWSEQTARWLREAVARGLPVLGVCYGHQLLAHALGGEVGFNPRGSELGTVEIALADEALGDPLLGGWGKTLRVQACHAQSVLRLPENARLLARNSWDPHHAFAVGPRAWGLQFHPEFDRDITQTYIRECASDLVAQGQDPAALEAACHETPSGPEILRRFAQITRQQRD